MALERKPVGNGIWHLCMHAIHQKLEADGTEKVEGSMTQKLENVLNRASNTADTLFQEVLGRKDKADSTRNALNVLQRFKFLFNLPLNIERNIQKGDYDVVINDYEKAKSLFGKTEVQVFKKYYAEVETRIEALRELLLDKLLETPSTLHDQKRYIRPKCGVGVLGPFASCSALLHSPMLDLDSDVRPSPIGHLSQTASLKRGSSFQSGRDDAWRYKAPQQVVFVEKLTKLVVSQLPNFWKLWVSYVNGSLFSEKMIQEVMHSLVKLIRGALLPFSLREGELRQYGGWEMKSELSGQWLTHVIQTVRLSSESLTALEIPNDMLQIIQDLILDLRVRCIIVTLQHTSEDIKRLAEKEDWVVDNEANNSFDFQPSQFEQCIIRSLQSLKTVLDCKPGEASEQRLLIALSNCRYLERHTFLNIAEHFEKHGFQGVDKITQVSMESLKELDQRLFEMYIEFKADPIVGSLEPGIYAGYFDWKDCLIPTGKPEANKALCYT
ncbi:hypothetical protein EK904_006455 [Melospiza melodia maxima]|nr:hypothetical protein EK904_006455 [Melospiza melodia maxima]